jgi:hypothetical protein
MNTKYIVFDLDDVIVCPLSYKPADTIKTVEAKLGKEFLENHKTKACGYTHLIFPYFGMLFEWLYSRNCKISFFSSGAKERNQELIPKLYRKFFPDSHQDLLKEVKIYSRDDCVNTDAIWDREKKEEFQPVFYGSRKKKLADVVVPKEDLPWALLIEDDKSYMCRGEEKNLVRVLGSSCYLPSCGNQDDILSFHKAFYLRAMMDRIFERAKQEKTTLAEAAFNLQVVETNLKFDRDFFYPTIHQDAIYQEGLIKFQHANPRCKFLF